MNTVTLYHKFKELTVDLPYLPRVGDVIHVTADDAAKLDEYGRKHYMVRVFTYSMYDKRFHLHLELR